MSVIVFLLNIFLGKMVVYFSSFLYHLNIFWSSKFCSKTLGGGKNDVEVPG